MALVSHHAIQMSLFPSVHLQQSQTAIPITFLANKNMFVVLIVINIVLCYFIIDTEFIPN